MTAEKQLPQDIAAEMATLGCLIDNRDAVARVVDGLGLAAEDFYRAAHRTIYRATVRLYCKDESDIDFITLTDELRRSGELEGVGGESYVTSLVNQIPPGGDGDVERYARIVQRCSRQRQWIKASGQVAALAYSELDADDLAERAEQIYAEVRAKSTPTAPNDGDLFPLLSDHEAEEIPAARGIVGDILYEDSLAILYGASGRWKSFLALAWSLCIATGKRWLGRPVVQGHVVYIAAEGGRGIGRRVTAWKRHHGLVDAPNFHLVPVPVNLLSVEHVDKLTRTIERLVAGMPVLIVIDTLSRSMPGGDENTAKDGSRAIAAADALRRAFNGVTVLMVAHPGKNEENGIRGWSGYFQWADTVMMVNGVTKARLDCGDVVTLTSEKPKEVEPFNDITFTAQRVEWIDHEGAPRSSLVLVSADKQPSAPTSPESPKRRAVWDLVNTHGPIQFSDLRRQLVDTHRMSKSTLSLHLNALEDDGQIAQNAFGAYIIPVPDGGPKGPIRSDLDHFGPVDAVYGKGPIWSDDSRESDQSDLPDQSTRPHQNGKVSA